MPYVALFSTHGKLIAYTDNSSLVRDVSARMGGVLDPPADPAERELFEARRRALKNLSRESGREAKE